MTLLDATKIGSSMLLFQLMPDNYLDYSEDKLGAKLSSKNAYINKRLSIIQKNSGMNRYLSFHKARHTFFVKGLRLGIDYMTLKELGGLSDVTILQKHYAEVVDKTMVNAMERFDQIDL